MGKKVIVCLICICIFLSLTLLTITKLSFRTGVTGKSSSTTGEITFRVLSKELIIDIVSPQPITYNFSDYHPNNSYAIDLNVTKNKENMTYWEYDLNGTRHNDTINESVLFWPNETIQAFRWNNTLKVRAYRNESDENATDQVSFFVNVPNQEPYPPNVSDNIYACEDNHPINLTDYGDENWTYNFTTTEVDEEDLNFSVFYYETSVPIKARFLSRERKNVSGQLYIPSYRNLVKSHAGNHPAAVRAVDPHHDMNRKNTTITVMERNDRPIIEDITVKTIENNGSIWTTGANSTFYEEVNVSDEEDGNRTSDQLNFSLSFEGNKTLFNISDNGVINFTATNETPTRVYNLTVCVQDSGIDNPHENISLCDQDGGPIVNCDNFSLTVTDDNRAPTITKHYPDTLNFSALGTEKLYFNITKYDPDGTIPHTNWTVDGRVVEEDSGNTSDEFTYTFGCGVGGEHHISANITDGLLGDSVGWKIDVSKVKCEVPAAPGGGAGVAAPACKEKWVCEEWSVCQNLEDTLESGIISGGDYRIVKNGCNNNKWYDQYCGVKFRNCSDKNNCNSTYNKPKEVSSCRYVKEPSCNDGFKNCHDGKCEFLVDCGGPCPPCPTCNDGKQNQGEEGVDCGGPCPWDCPEKKVVPEYTGVITIAAVIILIILIILAIEIKRIIKMRRELKNE